MQDDRMDVGERTERDHGAPAAPADGGVQPWNALADEAAPSRLLPVLGRVAVLCLVFGAAAAAMAVMAPGDPAKVLLAGVAGVAGLVLYAAVRGLLGRDRSGVARHASRLLDEAPEAYLITRRDGGVVYANQAYRQLVRVLGFAQTVSLERALAGRREAAQPLFRLVRAARRGLRVREDLPLRSRDGGLNWFWIEVQPLDTTHGPVAWRIVDASAQRDAGVEKAELNAARRRLGGWLDDAPVGLFAVTADGQVEFVNARMERMLGHEPGGLSRSGERPALSDLVARPDGILPAGPAEEEAARHWRPVRLPARDGGSIAAHIAVTPCDEETGPARMYLCAVSPDRQIGGRLDAAFDAAQKDAEAGFAALFLKAPVGIVLADLEGRVVRINPAAEHLAGRDVQPGAAVAELVTADHAEALAGLIGRAAGGEPAGEPLEVKLSVGGRSALVHASLLPGGPAQPAGVVLYLADITEQRHLEARFAQSQKMQAVGQLAGGIAHDFNNLLTAIIGFCDLLLSRHKLGDPSFKDINQIKQNATRAGNLTRQLLAFSRQQTLRPQVLQLTDTLADLSILLRRLLGERVQLEMIHGRDLDLVKVDRGQFEQVIVNLAVNARDAMPDGGKLTIRTANVASDGETLPGGHVVPPGAYVAIEVSDTGSGIPEDIMGKVFEPFFTTKGVGQGTGLGLSTVYGIVQQTGGYVFPENRAEGGAAFRIYLPRHAEAAAAAAPEESERPARDLTGRETILLVEDEDTVRTFAVRALASRGYRVLEAANGEDALDVLERHDGAVDILVSDVVMPVMDGPALAKKVRETRPDLPIILMSGYAESAFRTNMDRMEGFHFLPKPFTLKQLLSAVKKVAMGEAGHNPAPGGGAGGSGGGNDGGESRAASG